jgi:hypothetical protein
MTGKPIKKDEATIKEQNKTRLSMWLNKHNGADSMVHSMDTGLPLYAVYNSPSLDIDYEELDKLIEMVEEQ